MSNKILAYALDFVSFVMQKTKYKDEIKHILLFGSAARGEAIAKSDVDLFIDIIKENKSVGKDIQEIKEQFKASAKYKNYWRPLGVENEINLTIGKLNEWKELASSILANGIVLYGKFKAEAKGAHKTFFIWENIAPNTKRVLFNKQLFGYRQHKKFYVGALQKFNGERMGKGCIIVPLEHTVPVHALFKKNKIQVKIKKVVEY